MNYAAFTSYGNDSIALIQYLHEVGETGVYTVFSDTGWASPGWMDRVERAEGIARGYGFTPVRIGSEGFVQLARRKKAFPRNGMQFCTYELKIKPALTWLDQVDPDAELVCCVGIRREESASRAQWPGWTDDSENHGGRSLWAPLARVLERERDALIRRAGFEPLLHRSMECYPCVNANRADIRLLTDDRVDEIEELEASMGHTAKGKPRTLFRPYRHQGAVGIREVKKWADASRGGYEPPSSGCDSGFCGS